MDVKSDEIYKNYQEVSCVGKKPLYNILLYFPLVFTHVVDNWVKQVMFSWNGFFP